MLLPVNSDSQEEPRRETQTVRLSGTWGDRVVLAEVHKDILVIEGDIEIGKREKSRSAAINGILSLWPNGIIPYVITTEEVPPELVQEAIDDVSQSTNLSLIPRTNEGSYVKFIDDNITSSSIGRQGGMQNIRLADWVVKGNIIHEILHAAGIYHEHSRMDRDNFIAINWDSIRSGYGQNFSKYGNGQDLGPYDYGSIMHYGPDFFGCWRCDNGNVYCNSAPSGALDCFQSTTIVAPPGIEIGQREMLSPGDIAGINTLYPCNHPDYSTLVEFYNLLSGSVWVENGGWQSCDPCTGNLGNPWYGITCENNRVSKIKLSNNNLIGSWQNIDLSSLTHLKALHLDSNNITGLPTSLFSLLTLESLSFADNPNLIQGTFPHNIEALQNLKRIDFRKTGLVGGVSFSICDLSFLEEINLSENQLSGSLPDELGHLSNVTVVDFSSNNLSGCFPSSYDQFCDVSFDFSSNPGLPGGGDFHTFCNDGTGRCIYPCPREIVSTCQSSVCQWPSNTVLQSHQMIDLSGPYHIDQSSTIILRSPGEITLGAGITIESEANLIILSEGCDTSSQ